MKRLPDGSVVLEPIEAENLGEILKQGEDAMQCALEDLKPNLYGILKLRNAQEWLKAVREELRDAS